MEWLVVSSAKKKSIKFYQEFLDFRCTFKLQQTKLQNVYSPSIRDLEDSTLFYIALARLALVSLLDSYTMRIPLTPVLYSITTVIIEVYLQCSIESVSQRELGKSTSPAEVSRPNSLFRKAVKGAHIGSALKHK